MNGDILTKLITINQYQVDITLMTSKRSLGQRSRSASDDCRNLVNSIAPEPKLTQISCTVGSRTKQVFEIVGSEVKVIEDIFRKLGEKKRRRRTPSTHTFKRRCL